MTPNSISISRISQLAEEHPDALTATLCGILVILGSLALQLGWLGLAIFILPAAYVIGGYSSAREGLTTLFQEHELDVDLLMIVAALGAAGLGLWRHEYHLIVDGAVLILIFAISGALEGYAMQRTERSIRSLMSLTADTARVVLDGDEREIAIDKLQIGDRILVKPGEIIPTDAIIVEGASSLNQASITGESMPVEKTAGDEVYAGTINGFGAIQVEVHKTPESSLIQRVIMLVQQAQTAAPPSQMFVEKFERGYARFIVIIGLLLATLPPFIFGWNWEDTIYRALIFLVVASPCALMASIMPALLSGIANGAKQGILFKSGAQLEIIGKVRAIAFDKTGTLTTGKPEVIQIIPATGYSETEVLQLAAALETYSEHAIALAIVQAAQKQQLALPVATEIQAKVGQGIVGKINNQIISIGKANFVKATGELTQVSQQLQAAGKTVVWVSLGDKLLGIIAVADTLRPEAANTIKRLTKLGVEHIIMLTGDNQQTAQYIASELDIKEVYAELLPEDKVTVIQKLQKQYQTVAMVGDGINDAPALAQASVGIAMGISGSDVALETADIVLMADRLEQLAKAIILGRRAQNVVKQNIVFALSCIMLLLAANFLGNITMPLGVIGHEGSTVIVTLSGLRLLRN
ncbi:MAG: heavy metal translocating P-type ATPase [Oscillatoriales cyanobacterium]|uniref:Heavy metal translocating P-type ATPase n=1 Tax=Microcoleus anatoxicus PTRS2 TaxID=2705321 RepID=A0ABU8YUE4_9CYAN|nr:MAG: heavy metal translocating P-type ATPase [Oscillatoriales cyanobacterium]TAD93649.1 MAG: heavy metal translocating P-type ATPase [Oscillatoriales cyanobacterium]TAE05351.1 MAG: heavy metal translocating P-type ATPase [Oscillatoriales cyanobacterium]